MTATGHAIIGTVIAAKIGNPAIAIPVALASHFAADIFPHWDAGTNGKHKSKRQLLFEAAGDVLVGFALSYAVLAIFFPATDLVYAFIMIIVAQLPDWATAPYYVFGFNRQPFRAFYKFQSNFNTKLDKPWGIITQVALCAFLIFIATIKL